MDNKQYSARVKLVVKRDQHPYLVHVVLLSILYMRVIVMCCSCMQVLIRKQLYFYECLKRTVHQEMHHEKSSF